LLGIATSDVEFCKAIVIGVGRFSGTRPKFKRFLHHSSCYLLVIIDGKKYDSFQHGGNLLRAVKDKWLKALFF